MGGLFVVGGATMASFGYFGPIVAALLHNVSSFLVIFNSARLVRFEEELTESEEEEVKKPSPTTRPATV
jgi:hypothetical protein